MLKIFFTLENFKTIFEAYLIFFGILKCGKCGNSPKIKIGIELKEKYFFNQA